MFKIIFLENFFFRKCDFDFRNYKFHPIAKYRIANDAPHTSSTYQIYHIMIFEHLLIRRIEQYNRKQEIN